MGSRLAGGVGNDEVVAPAPVAMGARQLAERQVGDGRIASDEQARLSLHRGCCNGAIRSPARVDDCQRLI